MTAHFWKNESALFREALLVSLLLHGALVFWGRFTPTVFVSRNTVEIDLTHSARIGGSTNPSTRRAERIKPPAKLKEWVVPKKPQSITQPPQPEVVEPPQADEPLPAGENMALGKGSESTDGMGGGDGYMKVTQVSRYPQLLNLADLQSNLRRYYPEQERLKRNEGNVTLDLRIDEEGRVVSVETVRAASPAFEEAAKKVALLLKFKPAMVGRNKVAVKLRQTISFQLE